LEVDDVAELDEANERSICLFAEIAYLHVLRETKAAAVVTTPSLASSAVCTMDVLLVDQPRLAFAMIQQLFYPQPPLTAWISPLATISGQATIGAGCRIEPGAVIEAQVRLGEGCHVGPNAVIGEGVSLGAGCSIGANVTMSHTVAGDRVHVFANAAIGRPGFGFVKTARGLLRMPQLGRVVIGDDVEIGSGCTVDRGTLGDTRIGTGCKIDNGVQIAHNVTIGIGCILAGHVGIAGSATIEDFVVIGGGVVISDHVTVGTRVQRHRQTVAVTRLARQKPRAGQVCSGLRAVREDGATRAHPAEDQCLARPPRAARDQQVRGLPAALSPRGEVREARGTAPASDPGCMDDRVNHTTSAADELAE
jgi:UDP-3-O-[3-hydroxymyristoyl] glucosamine N-acyltransferase